MTEQDSRAGHRARLKQRFRFDSGALSDAELLELLLTYAIPRQDVAPIAQRLLARFGGVEGVVSASVGELLDVQGIGEQSALLLKAVNRLVDAIHNNGATQDATAEQPAGEQAPLFEMEPDLGPLFQQGPERVEPEVRTFADDEIASALAFIPEAARFESYEAFKAYLRERLPYNSASTRQRRASYILNRFFPEERLDVPLTYYAANCSSPEDLQPVVFYHVLKAEPIAARVAEELVWPALPRGRVEREEMRECILRALPELRETSQTKTLRSLFNTYDLLGVGAPDGSALSFRTHTGTLEAFLYVLTAEFARPGIYSFDDVEAGPMRRWLLWDREWMRGQLYNLRDLGLVSKISEIDRIRQFTLPFGQMVSLRQYFEHPQRGLLALRERPPHTEEMGSDA